MSKGREFFHLKMQNLQIDKRIDSMKQNTIDLMKKKSEIISQVRLSTYYQKYHHKSKMKKNIKYTCNDNLKQNYAQQQQYSRQHQSYFPKVSPHLHKQPQQQQQYTQNNRYKQNRIKTQEQKLISVYRVLKADDKMKMRKGGQSSSYNLQQLQEYERRYHEKITKLTENLSIFNCLNNHENNIRKYSYGNRQGGKGLVNKIEAGMKRKKIKVKSHLLNVNFNKNRKKQNIKPGGSTLMLLKTKSRPFQDSLDSQLRLQYNDNDDDNDDDDERQRRSSKQTSLISAQKISRLQQSILRMNRFSQTICHEPIQPWRDEQMGSENNLLGLFRRQSSSRF